MALEKLFKAVLGLFLIVIGVYGLVSWWASFLTILKGSVPVAVILIGILFLVLGFEK